MSFFFRHPLERFLTNKNTALHVVLSGIACKWSESKDVSQMLRRQMRIPHRHGDGGVPKDFLKGEEVAAVLDEVAGEGVAQDVGGLPFGELDGGSLQGPAEGCDARRELPVCAPVLPDPIRQLPGYRDRTDLA
jgi:hypothetical protein